jgi:hypothetical protein
MGYTDNTATFITVTESALLIAKPPDTKNFSSLPYKNNMHTRISK